MSKICMNCPHPNACQLAVKVCPHLPTMNPWHPIRDPKQLKTLGKLAEELGECSAAVARCIIQGVEESEPVTGKLNRNWLEEEIADVEAGLELVKQRFALNRSLIEKRAARKMAQLKLWHDMA